MALQDTDNLIVSRSNVNYRMPASQLLDYAGAKIEVSATAPVGAAEGTLWWDTVSGRLFVLYADIDSSQWIETSPQGTVPSPIKGGGTDQVFLENDQTVTANYTLTTAKNALTAGPVTINSGVTVTIPSGSSWVIV